MTKRLRLEKNAGGVGNGVRGGRVSGGVVSGGGGEGGEKGGPAKNKEKSLYGKLLSSISQKAEGHRRVSGCRALGVQSAHEVRAGKMERGRGGRKRKVWG